MNKVFASNQIPEKSIISENFGNIHYCDCYRIVIKTNETADSITTRIFALPQWIKRLLKFRNLIAKKLGLKTDSKTESPAPYYPIGSKAVLFKVIDRNESEIVMAENDKHLNFKTSVLTEQTGTLIQVSLTTIVHFNNTLGKLYFFPVKPFHKTLIQSRLKNIK